jgi:nitrite reductase (NO-forming)
VPNQIPPLAKSDLLMSDRTGAIRGVLQGRSGEISVNGAKYNGTMVSLNYLTDSQIANVLTFVRNSWGNSGDAVNIDEVRKLREAAPTKIAANPFE